jgi:hypothetical protein
MCSIVAEATGRRQDAKEKSLGAGIVRLPDDVRTVSTYKAQNAHQLTYIEKQAATCSPKTHQSTNNKPIKEINQSNLGNHTPLVRGRCRSGNLLLLTMQHGNHVHEARDVAIATKFMVR